MLWCIFYEIKNNLKGILISVGYRSTLSFTFLIYFLFFSYTFIIYYEKEVKEIQSNVYKRKLFGLCLVIRKSVGQNFFLNFLTNEWFPTTNKSVPPANISLTQCIILVVGSNSFFCEPYPICLPFSWKLILEFSINLTWSSGRQYRRNKFVFIHI